MSTFQQKPKVPQRATSAASTIPGRADHGGSDPENAILHLQSTIGNQAVQRLLQADPEGPNATSVDDSYSSGSLQMKLTVNAPGDVHEQEADRISEQVMRQPEPQLQGACQCDGECSGCKTEQPGREPESLRAKPFQAGGAGQIAAPQIQRFTGQPAGKMEAVPDSVKETLSSHGSPLEPNLRQDMEQRFGSDFRSVRVHNDSAADRAARSVSARAFTFGRHVAFATGQYAPESFAGRRLLAHELTHVVQQSGSRPAVIQRAPWGTCPAGARLTGARPDRYAAAEFSMIAYYKSVRSNNCVATNLDLFEELDCAGAAGRAFATHFRSGKNPRKTRQVKPAGKVVAPDPDDPTGTIDDFEGHATQEAFALLRPDIIDFTKREMYDVTTSGLASAKKGKLAGYVKLAETITKRSWSAGKTLEAPGGFYLNYRFRPGESICFGPTDFSKRAGVIAYEVIGTEEQKKKDKKQDEERKKKREEKKRKKEEAKKKREEAKRKKKEGKEKKPKEKKPKEKKPKEKKPKEQKPNEKKPGAPEGSAANIGFGINIGGSGGGAGNAGVGVSIMSNGHSYGTVSAGVTYDSDGVAVGSVGAGASSGSTAVGAGTAGAGLSEDTTSAAAGTAGAGSTKGSTSAAAGSAGAGKSKDDLTAGAGVAGKGESEGQVGAAAGKAGSAKPGTQPAGGKTGQEGKEGEEGAGEGKQSGAGKQPGKGTEPGKESGGTVPGPAGGQPGSIGKGTGTGAGKQRTEAGGEGAGTSKTGEPGKYGISIPGQAPATVDKAVEDAAKIEEMIRKARPEQQALMRYLAQVSGDDQYVVPGSTWVTTILKATDGIKDDDLAYLITLQWEPGKLTPDELKKEIEQALKRKGAKQAPGLPPEPAKQKPAPAKTPQADKVKPAKTPDLGKKPAKKVGAPGPAGPGDKEPKESEAEYIKRLTKRTAGYQGWAALSTAAVIHDGSGKPESMVLYIKAQSKKGGEVHATCDIYGQVVTNDKTKTLHIIKSGIIVTSIGETLPAGMMDGQKFQLE